VIYVAADTRNQEEGDDVEDDAWHVWHGMAWVQTQDGKRERERDRKRQILGRLTGEQNTSGSESRKRITPTRKEQGEGVFGSASGAG